MKPNWDEAPSWANWWAIDEGDDDGFAEWGWYEKEPRSRGWWWDSEDDDGVEYGYTENYRNGALYKEHRSAT